MLSGHFIRCVFLAVPLLAPWTLVAQEGLEEEIQAPDAIAVTSSPIATPAPAKSASDHDWDSLIYVNVAAPFEAKEAVGLLLSSQGVGEKAAISLEKVRDGLYVVSFGYYRGEVRKDTFASAMLVSADGATAFGDIRSLHPSAQMKSIYMLPKCAVESAKNVDTSKFGNYERLMSMRLERRESYRREISELMRGSFLDGLRKLEDGFGLTRGKALSADLTPVELIDRLSRLLPVVRDLSERGTADGSGK